MPHSSRTSRIALLFTSSSLARSLIRIFIRSAFPPGTRYTIIMTSRLNSRAFVKTHASKYHYRSTGDSSVLLFRLLLFLLSNLRLHGFFRGKLLRLAMSMDFSYVSRWSVFYSGEKLRLIGLPGSCRFCIL